MPVIFHSRRTMSGVRLLVDCFNNKTGIRFISRKDHCATGLSCFSETNTCFVVPAIHPMMGSIKIAGRSLLFIPQDS